MGYSAVEESLDEVHAMNTALCFLCSINADYREVELYLTIHPEALLFEGTSTEDSAQFVVEQQMRNCKCFTPECNCNRRRVLAAMNRGFEYYRGRMLDNKLRSDQTSSEDKSKWDLYVHHLRSIERDIREFRSQDVEVRSRILEARVAVRTFQIELEGVSQRENSINRSSLALLACRKSSDSFAHRSLLEYKLGIATLAMTSLEKEQTLIDKEKMASRRMQLTLLKKAFGGCRRHVCEASIRIA